MSHSLEDILRAACTPCPDRAEVLWARYRDAGDDAAFATLVAWYGGGVYRRVLFAVGFDRPLAEEAFQTAFRKLHEHRHHRACATFASALAWVRTTAANEARMAARSRHRGRARQTAAALNPATAAAPGPEAELLRREEFAELAAAFYRLRAEHREVLALIYFEDLTEARAAEVLGRHRETVSRWAREGLERLRELLASRGVLPAAGGAATAVAALTGAARAATLPPVRAATLAAAGVAGAADVAARTVPGWVRTGVLVLGLTAAGGLAVGGWQRSRPEPPAARPPPEAPAVVQLPTESLQAKNLRLLQDEVVPRLLEESRRTMPVDNQVSVTAVRAFGSEVEVEVRPVRPIPDFFPVALRLRFCVARRVMYATADVAGFGNWTRVDSARPITIEFPNPLVPSFMMTAVTGQDRWAATRSTFDLLPPDPRADEALIQQLFGRPGGDVRLPVGMHIAAFDGGWVARSDDFGLFIRDTAGRWRYAGQCPGWHPIVVDGRVYCTGHGMIRSRPLADPMAPWERVCDELPVELRYYFVADGKLGAAAFPPKFWTLSVGNPAPNWEPMENPHWLDGITVVGGQLYGYDHERLYSRPFADPKADLRPIGPWPKGCNALVPDGNRLVAFDHTRPGPIYARPLTAGPDDPWTEVGKVHDPYKR